MQLFPSWSSIEQLYDKNAPLMYGTVLRLADGLCAEEAFHDACVELWDTEAKRSVLYTTAHMVRVCIAKAREHCTKGGTTPDFERRLAVLVAELSASRAKVEPAVWVDAEPGTSVRP